MTDERGVGCWLSDNQGTGSVQKPLLPAQMVGPLRSGLLTGGDDQHGTGALFQRSTVSDAGLDKGSNAALHVAGAAAIDPVAVDIATKWINRPWLQTKWHRVQMAGKGKRQGIPAAEARDHIRAPLPERDCSDSEAILLQPLDNEGCALSLIARRVDRVLADQGLRERDSG
jgi:hypothetical protein